MGKPLKGIDRRIAILVPPDATLLDVTGPYEVFSRASHKMEAGRGAAGKYEVDVISSTKAKVLKTKFGLEIVCTQTFSTFATISILCWLPAVRDRSRPSRTSI